MHRADLARGQYERDREKLRGDVHRSTKVAWHQPRSAGMGSGEREALVHPLSYSLVFFVYGLAFFTMAVAIWIEVGRCPDARLRYALLPLAVFGLLHGGHEWLEMFLALYLPAGEVQAHLGWESARMGILAFSFLSLTAFGASLLAPNERMLRVSLLVPLIQAALWGFGLMILRSRFAISELVWDGVEVWTRYVLGVPSAAIAGAGLVAQQRAFRQAGMERFGRDSLWAAVAFIWYGLVGQMFTKPSAIPPSMYINDAVFQQTFGFPVQLLRGAAATVAAVYVIRFLRSFEVESQRRIDELRAARLQEARQRESLRGQLLKRVVAAQEAERQRIARELHDETGQALTAIGLGLRGIAGLLRRDQNRAGLNLRELEGLVARSLNELQRLIGDLRPSHLDDLGLPAALRWYVNDMQGRVPVHLSVDVSGETVEIPSPVKIALFRVAQEALTNVIKHANADQTHVQLHYADEEVLLQVKDDGCGFDPARLRRINRPIWGLVGMEERAKLLGGRLRLESRLGKGTLVEVRIPYNEHRQDQEEEVSHE